MAQVHALQAKKHGIAVALCLIAVITIVFVAYARFTSGFVIEKDQTSLARTESEIEEEAALTDTAENILSVVIVHIDGAVQAPGVYELSEDSRINDAVAKAGGLTEQADTSAVNLAAKLTDGQKVHIPTFEEVELSVSAAALTSEDGSSGSSFNESLVNINTATAEELDTLPGVGPATAATIIQDREDCGPFTSIEDLMRVSGIGEKKYAKLKDYICV